jgi:hypothetical protein
LDPERIWPGKRIDAIALIRSRFIHKAATAMWYIESTRKDIRLLCPAFRADMRMGAAEEQSDKAAGTSCSLGGCNGTPKGTGPPACRGGVGQVEEALLEENPSSGSRPIPFFCWTHVDAIALVRLSRPVACLPWAPERFHNGGVLCGSATGSFFLKKKPAESKGIRDTAMVEPL